MEVNKAAGALAGYECQENDMAYLKRLQDEARIKKLQVKYSPFFFSFIYCIHSAIFIMLLNFKASNIVIT